MGAAQSRFSLRIEKTEFLACALECFVPFAQSMVLCAIILPRMRALLIGRDMLHHLLEKMWDATCNIGHLRFLGDRDMDVLRASMACERARKADWKDSRSLSWCLFDFGSGKGGVVSQHEVVSGKRGLEGTCRSFF